MVFLLQEKMNSNDIDDNKDVANMNKDLKSKVESNDNKETVNKVSPLDIYNSLNTNYLSSKTNAKAGDNDEKILAEKLKSVNNKSKSDKNVSTIVAVNESNANVKKVDNIPSTKRIMSNLDSVPTNNNTGSSAAESINESKQIYSNTEINNAHALAEIEELKNIPKERKKSRAITNYTARIREKVATKKSEFVPQAPTISSGYSIIERIDEEKKEDGSYEKAQELVKTIFESEVMIVIMLILTIWALYGEDLKIACTDKDADLAFEVIISLAFFLFMLEMIAQAFYNDDYFNIPKYWTGKKDENEETTPNSSFLERFQFGSFYFWLDFVATLSLLLDMQWIIGDSLMNKINGSDTIDANNPAEASRATTTSAKVVRVIRMVRLVRIAKLYKYGAKLKNEQLAAFLDFTAEEHSSFDDKSIDTAASTKASSSSVENDNNPNIAEEESQVGRLMRDLVNKRVLIMVLVLLLVISLLSQEEFDISYLLSADFIQNMAVKNSTNPALYNSGLELAIKVSEDNLDVIGLNLNGIKYVYDTELIDSLRPIEKLIYESVTDDFTTQIIFDRRTYVQKAAEFSMGSTTFVIFLLLIGIYVFSMDINQLVITPIEKLVALVKRISLNPLGVEYKMLGDEDGFEEGMETTTLLSTITKVGGLLKVGFGEAGAGVIAKNLGSSKGGKLNLLSKGSIIRSIFGFCDVRQFTDTTECLQEDVMLFVNRIAFILHGIVVQCAGSANKNIGDAFLLTWKLDNLSLEEVENIADQALMAFCKSLVHLSRHESFIMRFSSSSMTRLYKRFPDYHVRIGCGLHAGWAVEGAIGSDRKIDASYISPHVNTSEFLESSTKAYGVPLLMSDAFHENLSNIAQSYCRKVDHIKRSGEEDPMTLFTYDADLSIDWESIDQQRRKRKAARGRRRWQSLKIKDINALRNKFDTGPISEPSIKEKQKRGSFTRFLLLKSGKSGKFKQDSDDDDNDLAAPKIVIKPYTKKSWVEDEDLVDMRSHYTAKLKKHWERAIDKYIEGKFEEAMKSLNSIVDFNENDGPTLHLIKRIKEAGGTAPANWPGYRQEE